MAQLRVTVSYVSPAFMPHHAVLDQEHNIGETAVKVKLSNFVDIVQIKIFVGAALIFFFAIGMSRNL